MYQVLAVVAALAASAAAVPAEVVDRSATLKGFTVEQVPVGKKFRNPYAEISKTYRKYGATPPEYVVSAAAAVQSGEVTATPEQYDEAYLCPVSIGSNSQTLTMDFDTGSSDFWVFSNLLPSSESKGHTLYNPSTSTSAKKQTGETWDIGYGDGSGAKGVVYADKAVIGHVTATSQSVEAATSVSSSFIEDTANDGLVGLAFDNINTCTPTVCKTFLNNVQATLPSPLFTSKLLKGKPGTYDFGYIDSTKYVAPITYVSVNPSKQGFWEFTASGYQVGSGSKVSDSLDCIADTGTTLLYLPTAIIDAYYDQVDGAEYDYQYDDEVAFPCDATLPNLSLNIGGVEHVIPGADLNYAPVGDGMCIGGLQNSEGIGFNILGDIFLKSQFVVWNFGTNQIGFAKQS